MSANQRCHVCWATGKPGCECPSCDKPECPFAERDKRRREMFAQFAVDAKKPGPLAPGVPGTRDHIAECSAATSAPLPPATDPGCGLGRNCWCEEGREIAACELRTDGVYRAAFEQWYDAQPDGRFTKTHGGPNPYYACKDCGEDVPGLRNLLVEHAATHGVLACGKPVTEGP